MAFSKATKKVLWRRIQILRGQLTGLMLKINNDDELQEIFIQTRSIERAIRGVESILLEDHLRNTYKEATEFDKHNAIKQLIGFFKR